MPKIALADTLYEWESTLAGMAEHPALDQPHLRELNGQLAALLEAVKELAAEQADLEGRRQAITQQLRVTRGKGEDVAISLRAAIRGALGHRNEGLTRFRIRPSRRRSKFDEADGVAVYPRPDLLPREAS